MEPKAFRKLSELVASGSWVELAYGAEPLFLVGVAARQYWAEHPAEAPIGALGTTTSDRHLLGRYLITLQLGGTPELDLRDDSSVIGALQRAGMKKEDAEDFLREADALVARSGDSFTLDDLEQFVELITRLAPLPASKPFLLEVLSSRTAARQLPLQSGPAYDALGKFELEEHRDAFTAKYIRELGTMFEKVWRRLGVLELLPVGDAVLQEASRTYLYGFTKSSVLLSAAAVERALLERLGLPDRTKFEDAIDAARAARVEEAVCVASDDLRRLRNRVAHRGYDPTQAEGSEALVKSRWIIRILAGD